MGGESEPVAAVDESGGDSTDRFIVIDRRDNVATAVDSLSRGETLDVRTADGQVGITLREDVPFGHKFALEAVACGGSVVKYGEVIGVASRAIESGDHVHVHNVDGLRGRGDKV